MPPNRSRFHRDASLQGRSEQKQPDPHNTTPALSHLEESSSSSAEPPGPGPAQTALRRLIAAPPPAVKPSDLLTLQRTLGNQAVTRLIQEAKSQPGQKVAPSPVSPTTATATIQRVVLMEAHTFTQRAGKPPKQLTELFGSAIRLLNNYHSILEGLWQEALAEKYLNNGIEGRYKSLLIGVVNSLKPVFTELKEKSDQLYEQKKKGRTILSLDPSFQKLKTFRQTVSELEDLVKKRMLVSAEFDELRTKIAGFLKEHNQQNVEQFIANHPEKILSQQDLDPNSVQTNVEGGAVNQVGLGTFLPRPGGGPIQTRLTGYTKTGLNSQGKEVFSEPGKGSGISEYDPRAALRSVATYKVSELIGLNIIPRTVLTQFTNQEGKQRLGQAMEKVSGAPGQSKHYVDFSKKLQEGEEKARILQAFAVLKNPQADPEALKEAKEKVVGKFTEFGGEVYANAAEDTITNFDWSNPVIERDLSTLQIFDLIIGHVDRHAGNLIVNYDPNDKNQVSGVKGIDNDDVMGRNFINPADPTPQGQGMGGFSDITKTPGLPPVLDFSVAVKLLNTEWENVAKELRTYTLPEAEIESAYKRWVVVIEHVLSLVMNNGLAYLGDRPQMRQLFQLRALMQRHGRVWNPNVELLKQWGTEATTNLLSAQNSYAGQYRQRAQNITQGNQLTVWNEPQYKA